jgi:hypothetical protein
MYLQTLKASKETILHCLQPIVLGCRCRSRVAGMDAAGGALGRAGAVLLTATCAVATYRAAAAGDIASVAYVVVSYGALLLLLCFILRA